ncbi:MAG TPA: imidazole glycerol phosphate synthase subunit HisF [bacterium]|nr:imidazole glycerol phosphate synthase subunit HisF [bacterium]
MLCKRIIPCLDVAEGRTVKGIRFQELRDVGDPVEQACAYQSQGADELVFLDISATNEGREAMLNAVEAVAARLMMPFTVGGGVSSVERASRLLERGADKVAVNTAAVERPELIDEIASCNGSQCCILAIDARRKGSSWEVLTHGGRRSSGRDAFEWAKEAVSRGAGEILLTSWDRDGTLSGFDLNLTRIFSTGLPVPVIASGGAAGPEHFLKVFKEARADAALAASIFHDGRFTVREIKEELKRNGVEVRL